jgi:integrase
MRANSSSGESSSLHLTSTSRTVASSPPAAREPPGSRWALRLAREVPRAAVGAFVDALYAVRLDALLVSRAAEAPSEWIALERRDVQRADGIVTISRTFSRGVLKGYGKTSRSRRRVPLSTRATDALDAIAPRLDSQLLFPGPRGKLIDLHNFRAREWNPRSKPPACHRDGSTTSGTRDQPLARRRTRLLRGNPCERASAWSTSPAATSSADPSTTRDGA